MTSVGTDPSTRDRWLPRVATIGGWALVALILVQAFLAGRHLFAAWTITVHGIIGNLVFAVGVVTAIATTVGPAGVDRKVASWVLVLLISAQVGLGYSGRTSLEAAAWHVPVGVTTLGLAVWTSSRAVGPPRRHAST